MQEVYNSFYKYFGENKFTFFFFVTYSLNIIVYWILSFAFLLIDLTGKPYKMTHLQLNKAREEKLIKYKKSGQVIKRVIINQVLYSIPVFIIFGHICQTQCQFETLPSFTTFLWNSFIIIASFEIIFYFSHRLFHVPILYKKYHWIHHEWQRPIALISQYCHPVEYVFSFLPTLLLG